MHDEIRKRGLKRVPLIMAALLSVAQLGCSDNRQNNGSSTELAKLPSATPNELATAGPVTRSVTLKTAADLPPYLHRNVQDEVFYFVMPDRFQNGDTDNDNGSKTIAISAGGFEPTDKGMFHGGDIAGLLQKLSYIKNLGISAIWLTPILRNQAVQADGAGYHGYWVLDFTEIDPHLGTNDELKAFIDAAHRENIKVFFDIIANHTADVIKYSECHGSDGLQWLTQNGCPYKSLAQIAAGDTYQTVIPAGQAHLKTPEWLNEVSYYHNQGDTSYQGENSLYGDFAGLDDIDTDNPAVVDGMTAIFKNLISDFKPDGFRIDTVKHVNMAFWSAFSPALVAHARTIGIPEFFMFGEVYSADSKVLSSFTTSGNIQSVLDFGFQAALQHTLIEQQGTNKFAELFARDGDYLDDDSNANQLLTFTGNHDMGRFAQMLRASKQNFSENDIIQRNLLAHAMMYFMRGIPIVYYGDEQGFIGDGGDKDARQDMMPSQVASYNDDDLLASSATTAADNFDPNHPFYRAFASYADIYYRYPALRHGEHTTLYAQNTPGIFAFSRNLATEKQHNIIVFNTATTIQTITLSANGGDYQPVYQGVGNGHALVVADQQLTITVPALSFAIYQPL